MPISPLSDSSSTLPSCWVPRQPCCQHCYAGSHGRLCAACLGLPRMFLLPVCSVQPDMCISAVTPHPPSRRSRQAMAPVAWIHRPRQRASIRLVIKARDPAAAGRTTVPATGLRRLASSMQHFRSFPVSPRHSTDSHMVSALATGFASYSSWYANSSVFKMFMSLRSSPFTARSP